MAIHFQQCRQGEVIVIFCSGILFGEGTAFVLKVRQIHVHIACKALEGFDGFVTAGVINHRNLQFVPDGVQSLPNMEHKMGGGNQIDVMGALLLQFHKNIRQPVCGDFLPKITAAYGGVLAEAAPQRAAGEEHGSRTV